MNNPNIVSFEPTSPALRNPSAWALAREVGGRIVVERLGVGERGRPGDVLAAAVGWTGASGSVRIGVGELDAAIEMLAADGGLDRSGLLAADGASDRSELLAWRFLREELGEGGSAVAVFCAAIDLRGHDDPFVEAVLAAVHRGRVESADGTTTLWRPVGPVELALLREADFSAWPPRLPDQPIFYPVLNESYAVEIARDWNVAASGSGFVTRFAVATAFARRYPTRQAGGPHHLELWIPADDVDELNSNLVGCVEVVGEHL